LGKYGSMLEENKADVASLVMADYLVSKNILASDLANKIYLTWATMELPAKQPSEGEAHRMRAVMQLNYFREKGALIFEKGGKLRVVPEKMAPVARQMLTEVVEFQLEGNAEKAQAFVETYAVWNGALQYAADEIMKTKPRLYRLLRQPVRDRILEAAPL
jgi:hypothetical protein